MNKNELVNIQKDLIPSLTPILILGAFAVFVTYSASPASPAVASILLVSALFTVEVATLPQG